VKGYSRKTYTIKIYCPAFHNQPAPQNPREGINVDRGTMTNKILLYTVTDVISNPQRQQMRKLSYGAQARNNRVEAALKNYRNKVYKSVNAAAGAHDVSEATLRRRLKGGKVEGGGQ
jgi:hypothetical protein